MLQLNCVHEASIAYQTLVWDVFFVSRGRGINLQTHFPWLNLSDADHWYVIATENGETVGGLCVQESSAAGTNETIASIGLVCVRTSHRGRGISAALLGRAVLEARQRSIAALRLWTNKPDVYLRHGFVLADISLYGWIKKPARPYGMVAFDKKPLADLASKKTPVGLPPFALSGFEWQSVDATVVTIEDEQGAIVAEWAGLPRDVALLLESVLPESARFNGQQGDKLIAELDAQGWKHDLAPSTLQMILPLTSWKDAKEWALSNTPRILHRI